MEEVEIGDTPINEIKKIELIEGNIKYKCQIQKDNDYLDISIYNNNKIKNKGQIHIYNIQYQLDILNFNIDEIFNEIYILKNNKFKLIKDNNKYVLKIELILFHTQRYINIKLYDNLDNNNNKNIEAIYGLKEIIKKLNIRIKLLEEELNKYDDKYDNFIIRDKEPKHILEYHTDKILCSTVLKDGRFVTGSNDKSIIIYNNKSFKPDLTIKEHKDGVTCLLQLNSGELVSCSYDKTIKIYNINENEYKVIQILQEHIKPVTKIIELKNKQLASCSLDKSIIFYKNDNNKYKKDYSITTNGINGPIIQTKDNEICYYEDEEDTLCFYDFIKRNKIKKINNISISYCIYDSLLMISQDLLLITGNNKISIVNVDSYDLIKTIEVDNSSWINAAFMLNKEMILTADQSKRIIQWKIKNDNLKLISIKENAHDDYIYTLQKLGNGLILSGGIDKSVKIW